MSTAITLIVLVLAILGVALGAASNIIHLIAPRTKTLLDDKAAIKIDELRAEVVKITDALKSVFPQVGALPGSLPLASPQPAATITTTTTVETAKPDHPTPAGAGAATGLAIALIFAALSVGTIACAASGTKLRAVEDGLAKCTAPEIAQGVAALEPLAASIVLAATSADGKQIDDSKLQAALSKSSLETDAGQFALCAVADVFAGLLTPAAATPGAPAAAALQVDPAAAHAAFDRLRAARAPGVRFATPHGEI